MRVLVTGATGFVGRWATSALTARGAEVIRLSRAASHSGDFEPVVVANLLDPNSIRSAVNEVRPNVVLHLAWDVSHGRFYQAAANLDWLAASVHLARAAIDAGVSRIVGVGTCVEYSPPENDDCDEDTTPAEPNTLYGISKEALRRVISRYAAENGFSFAWARLFYLFGPSEDARRLVPSVSIQLARGLPAELSSGRALRDFMDVRDVGEALAMLTLSDVTGTVNVGSGRAVSIGAVADQLVWLTSPAAAILFDAAPSPIGLTKLHGSSLQRGDSTPRSDIPLHGHCGTVSPRLTTGGKIKQRASRECYLSSLQHAGDGRHRLPAPSSDPAKPRLAGALDCPRGTGGRARYGAMRDVRICLESCL